MGRGSFCWKLIPTKPLPPLPKKNSNCRYGIYNIILRNITDSFHLEYLPVCFLMNTNSKFIPVLIPRNSFGIRIDPEKIYPPPHPEKSIPPHRKFHPPPSKIPHPLPHLTPKNPPPSPAFFGGFQLNHLPSKLAFFAEIKG